MSVLSIKNSDLYYLTNKAPLKSDVNLALIHGAGQDSRAWEYQSDFLDHSHFNYYILDLPGHGKSTGRCYKDLEQYRDIIKIFIDNLDLNNIVLIGHSMGGRIAQLFAIEYPQYLLGLVLVGTGAKVKVTKTIMRMVIEDYELFCSNAAKNSFSTKASESIKTPFYQRLLEQPKEICYLDFVANNKFDVRNKVKEIIIKTLIVAASEDILSAPTHSIFLNTEIPGSTLKIIKDSGHFMMQEKPEEFNTVLGKFLNSL